MKIIELISEQGTVGTVGSTTGMTQPVGQAPSISQNPAANSGTQNKPKDPNQAKLAQLLIQQGKNKPDDITKAATALQKTTQNPNNPNLSDEESELLGSLMGSTLKDPSTVTAIKAVAQQRPQQTQTTQSKPMGQM